MAHELDFSTGKAAIALKGGAKTAWHGLGQEILPGDSIEVIQKKAGLNWEVVQSPCEFRDRKGKMHTIPNQLANHRSDTSGYLGTVSKSNYNLVQPRDVMEFFKDFLADNKLSMETAGALKGGTIIWALAKVEDLTFLMPGKDRIDTYVRLQTTFDTSRATDLVGTSTRQVCANTKRLVDVDAAKSGFRVAHSSEFDAKTLQAAFGLLGKQYKVTREFWNELCKRKVSATERRKFFCELWGRDPADWDRVVDDKPVIAKQTKNQLLELEAAFEKGPGAQLKSASGTAFGLLQAVTYWCDHKDRVRDNGDGEKSSRLAKAWFGLGDTTKQDAEYLLAQLAGCEELLMQQELVAA